MLVAVTRLSAEVILETALAEDGLDGAATVAHALVQRAVDGRDGIACLSVALDRPVIGLGASAAAALCGFAGPCRQSMHRAGGHRCRQCARRRSVRCVSAEALVSQPKEGLFRLSAGDILRDFLTDENAAVSTAEEKVRELAAERAKVAGTDMAEVAVSRDIRTSTIEGQRMFIEARIVAVATAACARGVTIASRSAYAPAAATPASPSRPLGELTIRLRRAKARKPKTKTDRKDFRDDGFHPGRRPAD